MILCLTPNPAIDRTLLLPDLVLGNVHRAQKIMVAAGGKGLNVARTIRALGGEPFSMGFAGGHSGRLLADLAQNEGLASSWTWTNSETRTCTILVAQDGDATVINEPGLSVLPSDWKRLQRDVRKHLSVAGLACISGSLPPSSSIQDFQKILEILVKAGKRVWVDTTGPALKMAMTQAGICIKVNGSELGQILGLEVKDFDSGRRALTMLKNQAVTSAVITLGSRGALLATKEGRWYAQGPRVNVISTVGSGDAFLGGLVSALDAGKNWPEALRHAIAAGTANALSAGGGQFSLQEFEEIQRQVTIEDW